MLPKPRKELSCKDRVATHMESRLQDLRSLWTAFQNGEEDGVEGLGTFHDYGLSFDYVPPETFAGQEEGYFRYQLSWGGPSDEFRFFTGPELIPHRIEYWFMDWFDGASIILTDKDKSFMRDIFDWFADAGTVKAEYRKWEEE